MTINNYLIPLTNVPQIFEITLAGVIYTLTCRWNDADDAGWTMDIGDSNNAPIACNIPLITGADLLQNLKYLGIGGKLFVFTDGDPFKVPTLDNLGAESNLYFQTSDPNE